MLKQKILKYSKNNNIECCVLTGSKAKGFRNDFFPQAAKAFLEKGIPVIMDVRLDDLKDTLSLLQNQNDYLSRLIIKLNGNEFVETFGYVDLFDVASEYNVNVVVTYGENGSSCIYHGDKTIKTFPAEKIGPIINTTGCGDAFAAGMASLICRNFNKELFYKSVEFGNHLAGIKATKIGPSL
jgi:sugar/nucleoside kinase (ribokinase family)